VLVTPGDEPSGTATASEWFITPGGEIAGITDYTNCSDGLNAAERPKRLGLKPPGVALTHYDNPFLGVELDYPAGWLADPNYRGNFGHPPTAYRGPAGRAARLRTR